MRCPLLKKLDLYLLFLLRRFVLYTLTNLSTDYRKMKCIVNLIFLKKYDKIRRNLTNIPMPQDIQVISSSSRRQEMPVEDLTQVPGNTHMPSVQTRVGGLLNLTESS